MRSAATEKKANSDSEIKQHPFDPFDSCGGRYVPTSIRQFFLVISSTRLFFPCVAWLDYLFLTWGQMAIIIIIFTFMRFKSSQDSNGPCLSSFIKPYMPVAMSLWMSVHYTIKYTLIQVLICKSVNMFKPCTYILILTLCPVCPQLSNFSKEFFIP